MNSERLSGALIGCGFFAVNHMHAWSGIDQVDITSVCDLDENKARAMAKEFGAAQFFTSAESMFAAVELDFVDIATTPATHRQLVELACQNTRNVICQKPFAENLSDAESMVAAANAADATLLVHENFRWQAGFVKISELIDQGVIGQPHFSRFSFRHGYDNYRNQPYLAEIERFSIMDVGLHLFDLARVFMGEVERITCHTQQLNPIVRGEDAFTALLSHTSGGASVVDCSFYSKISPEPFPQTVAWIEGSKGTLQLDADYQLILHHAGGRECYDVEPKVPAWGEKPWHGVQDSVVRFQNHALDVFTGKVKGRPDAEDNLNTLSLALAAYDSARTGSAIVMSEWASGVQI